MYIHFICCNWSDYIKICVGDLFSKEMHSHRNSHLNLRVGSFKIHLCHEGIFICFKWNHKFSTGENWGHNFPVLILWLWIMSLFYAGRTKLEDLFHQFRGRLETNWVSDWRMEEILNVSIPNKFKIICNI